MSRLAFNSTRRGAFLCDRACSDDPRKHTSSIISGIIILILMDVHCHNNNNNFFDEIFDAARKKGPEIKFIGTLKIVIVLN